MEITFINVTPHPLVFRKEDGSEFVVEPCGFTAPAKPVETLVREDNGLTFVRTDFVGTPEASEELDRLIGETPGVVVIGSMYSAQAYPGRVVAVTPAKGFERVPPAERRVNPSKFTTFGS